MMDERTLQRDLALFADLGTDPPRMMPPHNGRLVARMFRGGEELQLEFHANGSGKVLERPLGGGEPRTHASYKALLASERFGNLRRWADSQRTLFKGMYEGAALRATRLGGAGRTRGRRRPRGDEQLPGRPTDRAGSRGSPVDRWSGRYRKDSVHRELGGTTRNRLRDAPASSAAPRGEPRASTDVHPGLDRVQLAANASACNVRSSARPGP